MLKMEVFPKFISSLLLTRIRQRTEIYIVDDRTLEDLCTPKISVNLTDPFEWSRSSKNEFLIKMPSFRVDYLPKHEPPGELHFIV